MRYSKNRIYIQHWLALKPYSKQVASDKFYLNLSNAIQEEILSSKEALDFFRNIEPQSISLLSCFLASYVEDLVSETNLWNTFVSQHTKRYNKPLPFYHSGEYFHNEINVDDIAFLLWYFINSQQEEVFLSPSNTFLQTLAEKLYPLLENAWSVAPENETLKSILSLEQDESDFYVVRSFIDQILFQSYLFYPNTRRRLTKAEGSIIDHYSDSNTVLSYLQENRDNMGNAICTSLLALRGNEWAAHILGEKHPLFEDILLISPKIKSLFFYKGQDTNHIFFEHIASGKYFKLTKKSYEEPERLRIIDSIFYIGMVKWQNEWWFSGITAEIGFNNELVATEKNSLESRAEVDFLNYQKQNVDEVLRKQFEDFLGFTQGKSLVFMESKKIDEFVEDYFKYEESLLNLSPEEKEAAIRRAHDSGFFGGDDSLKKDFTEEAESGLVFFNPQSGIEIAFDVNSAFPMADNPYYSEQDSKDHLFAVFMNEGFSKELAIYCVENFKDKIPFLQSDEGKSFVQELDFLLRFWKKEKYHSKPSITFTGIEEEKF